MARNRKEENQNCTAHRINLCPENKFHVLVMKAGIEKKHPSNFSQALNAIVEEWAEYKHQQLITQIQKDNPVVK